MHASGTNQFLPELISVNGQKSVEIESRRDANKPLRASVQTQTNPSPIGQLDELPSVVPNSSLVHRRASNASAGDHLAAASVNTGASLPLMIGGRSKCVLNVVGEQQKPAKSGPGPATTATAATGPAPHAQASQALVPQNTAARAEQRRQNMAHVSVVRPVVNLEQQQQQQQRQQQTINFEPFGHPPAAPPLVQQRDGKLSSLIDDWMMFDKTIGSKGANPDSLLDELIMGSKLNGPLCQLDRGPITSWQAQTTLRNVYAAPKTAQEFIKSEQELRQQVALLRREEHELNRGVMRQHRFILNKIEERKRYLQIIQSVWAQRDFKHAIEKMLDIYHQGLIFTCDTQNQLEAKQQSGLRSLNTSLVVDVIGIIILRPKLWSLEICQLLLPIINSDLLVQTGREHEYYVEIGLKAIKLILTHFSSILKSTLDSLKESSKLVGIDLSREDRINKCLACYKLLHESHTIIATASTVCKQSGGYENAAGQSCKLASLYHELRAMLGALLASINVEPGQLARRFNSER